MLPLPAARQAGGVGQKESVTVSQPLDPILLISGRELQNSKGF